VIVAAEQSICQPSNGTVFDDVCPEPSVNSSVAPMPLVTQIARAQSEPVGESAIRSIALAKDV